MRRSAASDDSVQVDVPLLLDVRVDDRAPDETRPRIHRRCDGPGCVPRGSKVVGCHGGEKGATVQPIAYGERGYKTASVLRHRVNAVELGYLVPVKVVARQLEDSRRSAPRLTAVRRSLGLHGVRGVRLVDLYPVVKNVPPVDEQQLSVDVRTGARVQLDLIERDVIAAAVVERAPVAVTEGERPGIVAQVDDEAVPVIEPKVWPETIVRGLINGGRQFERATFVSHRQLHGVQARALDLQTAVGLKRPR